MTEVISQNHKFSNHRRAELSSKRICAKSLSIKSENTWTHRPVCFPFWTRSCSFATNNPTFSVSSLLFSLFFFLPKRHQKPNQWRIKWKETKTNNELRFFPPFDTISRWLQIIFHWKQCQNGNRLDSSIQWRTDELLWSWIRWFECLISPCRVINEMFSFLFRCWAFVYAFLTVARSIDCGLAWLGERWMSTGVWMKNAF